MDRKNFRIFFKNDDQGFSFLLSNKNKTNSCIFEKSVIATLDEEHTNRLIPSYKKIADCFCCLGLFTSLDQVNYLVIVITAEWKTKLIDIDIYNIKEVQFLELSTKPYNETNEANGVKKLLESGYFYFGKGLKGKSADISVNIQNRHNGIETDEHFIWNKYLLTKFKHYGIDSDWYTVAICGGIEASSIYASENNIKICLISRVNCQRIGTRFVFRGIDDNGYVANFVETEQCFINNDGSQLTSYVQVRGSVPLFWAEPGVQVGAHKFKITRSLELSSLAYERHFTRLESKYGRVQIVNLLGSGDGERKLSLAYNECHRNSKFAANIKIINFDYHKEVGNRSKNIDKLKSELEEFVGETHFCWIINGEIVQRQFGIVRTNCVDCLDRTNAVQTVIALSFVLEKQLNAIMANGKSKLDSVLDNFRAMWKANGDFVSQIYAGSGAIGSSNKLADAQKSMKRTLQANFSDSHKNITIAALLRPNSLPEDSAHRAKQLLPAEVLSYDPQLLLALVRGSLEVADRRPLQVLVGTWNVNGSKNFSSSAHKHRSISDWLIELPRQTLADTRQLIDSKSDLDVVTDVFAIGFQEIVDLTARNIVKTNSEQQRNWATHIIDTISGFNNVDYVLLNTIQLVGICLFVYVKAALAPYITNVSTARIKTGFKGTVGNKGGVAVSFQLYSSSFCFVCSHFAAGQSNTKERNECYRDIERSMRFQNGMDIQCHDYVFWCGDFNYRIDMAIDDVKQLVSERRYDELRVNDQLCCQRNSGKVFNKFKEGTTSFAPTYKYDLLCENYDTSDKSRIPAWTDRVLWKVNVTNQNKEELCRLLMYNRAELMTSDHRPVAAMFKVKALEVNKQRRSEMIIKEMLSHGPINSTIRVTLDRFQRASDIPDDLLNLIIKNFSEAGQIVLMRFSGADLLLNYDNSRSAVDAVNSFNETYVNNAEYLVRVQIFDRDWSQNIRRKFKEDVTVSVQKYPSLLTELIQNTNQRCSILHDDYFFNEDDYDVKDDRGARTRARSCSSNRKDAANELVPEKVGQLTSSALDLAEKLEIEKALTKRTPPMRPPPITNLNATTTEDEHIVLRVPKIVVEDCDLEDPTPVVRMRR